MPRILIIEDDDLVRSMLKATFERAGYEVIDAPNGRKGIQLNNEHPADLIITDIFMPEKEGLETIQEFKKAFPEKKIIAISGGAQTGGVSLNAEFYLKAAKGFGAIRTFTKPVDRKELLAAVQELIET